MHDVAYTRDRSHGAGARSRRLRRPGCCGFLDLRLGRRWQVDADRPSLVRLPDCSTRIRCGADSRYFALRNDRVLASLILRCWSMDWRRSASRELLSM